MSEYDPHEWTLVYEPTGRLSDFKQLQMHCDGTERGARDCDEKALYFTARSVRTRPTACLCEKHFEERKRRWEKAGHAWAVRDADDPIVKRKVKESEDADRRANDELNREFRRRLGRG